MRLASVGHPFKPDLLTPFRRTHPPLFTRRPRVCLAIAYNHKEVPRPTQLALLFEIASPGLAHTSAADSQSTWSADRGPTPGAAHMGIGADPHPQNVHGIGARRRPWPLVTP